MGLHVKAGTITTGLFALLLIGSVTLAAVTLARTFETANDVDRLRRDLATVERTLEDVGSAAAGACVGSRWNRDALVAVLGAVGVPPMSLPTSAPAWRKSRSSTAGSSPASAGPRSRSGRG